MFRHACPVLLVPYVAQKVVSLLQTARLAMPVSIVESLAYLNLLDHATLDSIARLACWQIAHARKDTNVQWDSLVLKGLVRQYHVLVAFICPAWALQCANLALLGTSAIRLQPLCAQPQVTARWVPLIGLYALPGRTVMWKVCVAMNTLVRASRAPLDSFVKEASSSDIVLLGTFANPATAYPHQYRRRSTVMQIQRQAIFQKTRVQCLEDRVIPAISACLERTCLPHARQRHIELKRVPSKLLIALHAQRARLAIKERFHRSRVLSDFTAWKVHPRFHVCQEHTAMK
jgi:hypothetical protein